MTFRPKSVSNKEKILAVITAIAAVALFAASGFVSRFPVLYQVSAIVFAVVSIEIYMKYVASDYVYEADENSLKVYRITGKKSLCICSLDYEMSKSLVVKSSDYLANKNKYPKYNFNVNFAKNLNPKDYSVYFFEFKDKVCMAKFEPDDEFVKFVNGKISSSLKETN